MQQSHFYSSLILVVVWAMHRHYGLITRRCYDFTCYLDFIRINFFSWKISLLHSRTDWNTYKRRKLVVNIGITTLYTKRFEGYGWSLQIRSISSFFLIRFWYDKVSVRCMWYTTHVQYLEVTYIYLMLI